MFGGRPEGDQENIWPVFFISIGLYVLAAVAFVSGYASITDRTASEVLKMFGIPLLIALGVLVHRVRPKA